MARICIVTAGHLSTSPRMLKAADALAGAGHRVRVVSTRHLPWAIETDRATRRTRSRAWAWVTVDYDRRHARLTHLWTGARFRAMRAAARLLGPRQWGLHLAAAAWSRAHPELVRAALREPADFLYGGGAALAAVGEVARRTGVVYAIDLEDFHTGERPDSPAARLAHALAGRIERAVLPRAAFLTAASAGIADAYVDRYGMRPIVVHNTFPLPRTSPDLDARRERGLKLYWFSQTIGPGRGLEDAVRGMGLASIPGQLHLRGRPIVQYLTDLRRLAARLAPSLEIVHHPPAPPDVMVELCAAYDVGLALEPGVSFNNELALSNKAFTYILAGLAVAFTDTAGQRPLALELGEGAILYRPGDVGALAQSLRRWADDRALFARARAAAWEAARRRWHWEHPEERGAFLAACTAALRHSAPCAS